MDGQNLFHSAREAFGYGSPNYDVLALAHAVCRGHAWRIVQVRFYTGVPDPADNASWHRYWTVKTAAMRRRGIVVHTGRLGYRTQSVTLPDGMRHTLRLGREKGIQARLMLDIVRLAHRREFDVGIVFSQHQDLSEASSEIRRIAREQRRWIKLACAFPFGPASRNVRGVHGTDWIRIHQAIYDECVDPHDYRSVR